jgi:hypothetical protein
VRESSPEGINASTLPIGAITGTGQGTLRAKTRIYKGIILRSLCYWKYKIVFSDNDAGNWLKKYREYAGKHDVNTQSRIEDMVRESERIEEQIENIALTIAKSVSTRRSLVDMIEKLESQKGEIDKQIAEAERLSKVVDVRGEDIRYHYEKARELFRSGELPEIR